MSRETDYLDAIEDAELELKEALTLRAVAVAAWVVVVNVFIAGVVAVCVTTPESGPWTGALIAVGGAVVAGFFLFFWCVDHVARGVRGARRELRAAQRAWRNATGV